MQRPSLALACLLALLLIAACLTPVDAGRHRLRQRIQAAQRASNSDPSQALDAQLEHVLESSAALRALQEQVARVGAQLHSLIEAQASGADTDGAQGLSAEESGAQIAQILSTLQHLSASQSEIESSHAAQSAADHHSLMQLLDAQRAQQAQLSEELAHGAHIEAQLEQLRAMQRQHEQNMGAAGQDEAEAALQWGGEGEDPAASARFLELSLEFPRHPHEWLSHPHAEHDIDLSHTMDHASESALEEIERRLRADEAEGRSQGYSGGLLEAHSTAHLAAQGQAHVDPSRYGSSADYLAAMNSAEYAEHMNPAQLSAFGERLGMQPPSPIDAPGGNPRRHSMSEIDSLVEAAQGQYGGGGSMGGYGEASPPEPYSFDPSTLRSPELAQQLGGGAGPHGLHNPDAIHAAMLRAQTRIRAIAAELEKHQQASGADPAKGLEIEFDLSADGAPEGY